MLVDRLDACRVSLGNSEDFLRVLVFEPLEPLRIIGKPEVGPFRLEPCDGRASDEVARLRDLQSRCEVSRTVEQLGSESKRPADEAREMLERVLVAATLDLARGLDLRCPKKLKVSTSESRHCGAERLTTRSGLPGTTSTFLNSSRLAVSIAFRYIFAYIGVLPRRRTWLGKGKAASQL